MTERRLFQGRPRPSDRILGFGISGSRVFHCFVGQITRMAHSVLMHCGTFRVLRNHFRLGYPLGQSRRRTRETAPAERASHSLDV